MATMILESTDPPPDSPSREIFDAADLLAVFEATPGVNLLLAADSPRFTMVLASDGRLEATMTTREGTLGRPLFEVFPDANPENPAPSGVDNLRSSLEIVLSTRQAHRMKTQRYDLRRTDGSWEERYWSPLNAPVLGADGSVRFVLHQVTDVTDEVRGRQALAKAEQRAARILDRMADAHWVLDSDLNVVTLNGAAEKLTGRARVDMLGRPHADAFPQSYRLATDAAFRSVLAGGGEQHLQQHYLEGRREVTLEIDAYGTDEGGVAIFARDISERVRNVEVLRRGERQRFLTQLSDAMHAASEAETVLVTAVQLLAGQLGVERAVYVETEEGDDERFILRAEHRDGRLAPFVASGRFDDFGSCLMAELRSGRPLIVQDTDTLAPSPGRALALREAAGVRACVLLPTVREGRIVACIGVVQSMPREWSGDEISLIEETAERTRIAVARARAESALRDSDRRKDEFLATLAHELRNPLAPVRNGLQILRLAATDALTTSKTLGVMERQLVHMARLIDDLLDVSRITRGKVALKRERLALRTVFDSAIEASKHLVDGGRHALTLHVPYEPIYLDADATRLAQVVGNLINNAAKYTPEGGQIDIYAEREGDEVVIQVQDSGVGIPATMLSHVFDMFAQVGGSSLERSQGGLGIGLSISKQLVLMHGGSIRVESPGLGQGSTFTVRLPLAADTEISGVGAVADDSVPESASRRILVVDDNIDAADSFSTMLGLFGHEVCTAYSGAEALEVAARCKPAIIFCDIGMPGMSGYQVAQQIRANPELAETRLVAVSGWGSEEDKRRATDAGFDLHLAKPADWTAVREAIGADR